MYTCTHSLIPFRYSVQLSHISRERSLKSLLRGAWHHWISMHSLQFVFHGGNCFLTGDELTNFTRSEEPSICTALMKGMRLCHKTRGICSTEYASKPPSRNTWHVQGQSGVKYENPWHELKFCFIFHRQRGTERNHLYKFRWIRDSMFVSLKFLRPLEEMWHLTHRTCLTASPLEWFALPTSVGSSRVVSIYCFPKGQLFLRLVSIEHTFYLP